MANIPRDKNSAGARARSVAQESADRVKTKGSNLLVRTLKRAGQDIMNRVEPIKQVARGSIGGAIDAQMEVKAKKKELEAEQKRDEYDTSKRTIGMRTAVEKARDGRNRGAALDYAAQRAKARRGEPQKASSLIRAPVQVTRANGTTYTQQRQVTEDYAKGKKPKRN